MAYSKADDGAYRKLLGDLKAGTVGQLYLFHGEESYLKDNCLSRLRALLCAGFEAFNYVFLEGERLTADDLNDAINTLPMGERKLVVVRDYKLMQPAGELKEQLPQLLATLPQYICLVFYYDTVAFKADKRLSIYKALEQHGSIVEFQRAPASDLIPWLKRHFRTRGKEMDSAVCEHMLFLCGYSMTNLVTEVDKIAAGTLGPVITRADVDALASRVLEADVFALTDSLLAGSLDRALHMVRDLMDLRHEPVAVLAAILKQWHRLYGARLAIEAGGDERYVMELCGFRSTYPARLLIKSARGMSLRFLRQAQQWCLACDAQLKSNVSDDGRTLELLLLRLSGRSA